MASEFLDEWFLIYTTTLRESFFNYEQCYNKFIHVATRYTPTYAENYMYRACGKQCEFVEEKRLFG